jgi:hypothetical protein
MFADKTQPFVATRHAVIASVDIVCHCFQLLLVCFTAISHEFVDCSLRLTLFVSVLK